MHTEEGSDYASDVEEKQKKENHYALSVKWINVAKSIVFDRSLHESRLLQPFRDGGEESRSRD